jgi:hypothetical protein
MDLNHNIVTKFNENYSNWDIAISEAILINDFTYEIKKRGWIIRFVCIENNNQECIEVYAMHRMTSDRHYIIDTEGEIETLEVPTGMFSFDREVEGDLEKKREENQKRNRRIHAELKMKGLVN